MLYTGSVQVISKYLYAASRGLLPTSPLRILVCCSSVRFNLSLMEKKCAFRPTSAAIDLTLWIPCLSCSALPIFKAMAQRSGGLPLIGILRVPFQTLPMCRSVLRQDIKSHFDFGGYRMAPECVSDEWMALWLESALGLHGPAQWPCDRVSAKWFLSLGVSSAHRSPRAWVKSGEQISHT